jgi:predicted 3-demethylubiquinone-9 3-methyltransferase (glyoxalase superfamily)
VQKVTPFLWFDNNAEEAADFYVSIFKNSLITSINRYTGEGPGPEGSVMTVAFQLEGQEFVALNGGPVFKFTPAISFAVDCKNQQEVDFLWEKLSSGGRELDCGWVTDRFGISWQIVPAALVELLSDPDREKAKKVMAAMLKMKKLDIETLKMAAQA